MWLLPCYMVTFSERKMAKHLIFLTSLLISCVTAQLSQDLSLHSENLVRMFRDYLLSDEQHFQLLRDTREVQFNESKKTFILYTTQFKMFNDKIIVGFYHFIYIFIQTQEWYEEMPQCPTEYKISPCGMNLDQECVFARQTNLLCLNNALIRLVTASIWVLLYRSVTSPLQRRILVVLKHVDYAMVCTVLHVYSLLKIFIRTHV